jgi:AraC-like DNA-binding protein
VTEQEHLSLQLVYLKSPAEWAHNREGLAFIFVESGHGNYVCGRITQRSSPGDVLISNGGRGGKLRVANGGGMAFRTFSISLEHLYPLFAVEEISLLEALAESLRGPRLFPASSSLAKECHRLIKSVPTEWTLDHRSQLLRVAAVVLTEEFKAARGRRAGFVRAQEHIAQVLQNLSSQELLSFSVDELAARFGCSRRQLNRLFHEYFGISVAALRMDMRMLKAVSLLRNPDAKVINVAEQCGFNHLGLFNTCFKRRFGASPGQWRKKATKGVGSSGPELAGSACPLHSNGICPLDEKANGNAAEPPKALNFMLSTPAPARGGVRATLGRSAQAVVTVQTSNWEPASRLANPEAGRSWP